ncbi:hypothetical protein [Streptococcus oricebi]|nr:hypothetical protein [Streptococcus oricebi]
MNKKMKLLALLLGVMVMMLGLSGCNKNSRAHVEKQFADLGKIYPTKNVEDLFKVFPEGFQIIYTHSKDSDGKDISYFINVSGNPENKRIKGIVEKKITVVNNGISDMKMLYKHNIELTKEGWKSLDKDYTLDDIVKETQFLFQKNTFNKNILSSYKIIESNYNSNISAYHIAYYLNNDLLSLNNLDISKKDEAKNFILSFTRNNESNKYIEINMSTPLSFKSETIIEKFKE